jgi:hypothetical protein
MPATTLIIGSLWFVVAAAHLLLTLVHQTYLHMLQCLYVYCPTNNPYHFLELNMSKLGCLCGAVIYDQTDNLPYKGKILRDQHTEQFYDEMLVRVNAFVAAIREGRREEWLASQMSALNPIRLSDDEIIHDLIFAFFLRYSLDIYQCETCGRIWIQEHPTSNHFRSFTPDATWEGTLAAESQTT